jgi:hypothetical protein
MVPLSLGGRVARSAFRSAFMPARVNRQRYDVHPGVAMMQDWIVSLKAKTGRSLPGWVTHIRKEGPPGEAARRDWLKTEFGLGTNSAWWLAERSAKTDDAPGDEDPDVYLAMAERYVEDQYQAKRAGLRPVYDALYTLSRSLGADIRLCPCKTTVPVYREHVIAQIKPTTNTRLDLGLALGKYTRKLPAPLIDTGGRVKKDRITHRLPLSSVEEIGSDVGKWLRAAYELDG